MRFYVFSLLALPLLVTSCAADEGDNMPSPDTVGAGGGSSSAVEATEEIEQEAGSCPTTLNCAFPQYIFQNVCDANGKTTEFRCYNTGSTSYTVHKPSKNCAYCYPYDWSTPWCNNLSGLNQFTPWAKCYSAPKLGSPPPQGVRKKGSSQLPAPFCHLYGHTS